MQRPSFRTIIPSMIKEFSAGTCAALRRKIYGAFFLGFTIFIPVLVPKFAIAADIDICDQCVGSANVDGPCYAGKGGPRYAGLGGPCYAGVGGPRYAGAGGPRYAGKGGPLYAGKGGPRYAGKGGPCYAGKDGPCSTKKGVLNPDCPSICIGR